jgi:hypothetical protein
MTTASSFLLLSIIILTSGISFTNLYTIDSVLAKEPFCNLEILSLLPCTLGSENRGSSVSASSGTVQEQKENDNNNDIDSTSIMGQVVTGEDVDENKNDNMHSNIESQIPSTIGAIPFP